MWWDQRKRCFHCDDCNDDFWDEDESHCPKHEHRNDVRERLAELEATKGHIMSIRSQKEVLPPIPAYISKSSGHRKTGKNQRSKKRTLREIWLSLFR